MKISLERKASATSVLIILVSIIITTSIATAETMTVVEGTVTKFVEITDTVTVKDKEGNLIESEVDRYKNGEPTVSDKVNVTSYDDDGTTIITLEIRKNIVPEFPNIMLPAVTVMGIMFMMSRTRRRAE